MPKKQYENITFRASLPAIQSAIQTHGAGDGYMVKLDVPQSEALSVMKLGMCTSRVFEVKVRVLEDDDDFPHSAG